ncbi:hypothetical protein Bca101_010421 [Brassica carinata]
MTCTGQTSNLSHSRREIVLNRNLLHHLSHPLKPSPFLLPLKHFLCSPQILEPWQKGSLFSPILLRDFNKAEVLREWFL